MKIGNDVTIEPTVPNGKNGHSTSKKSSNGHANGNGNGHQAEAAPAASKPASSGPIKDQLRHLLHTVKSVRQGDFTVRFPSGDGLVSEIGEVVNDIIELNESLANEFIRVSR